MMMVNTDCNGLGNRFSRIQPCRPEVLAGGADGGTVSVRT
jgi:hypothetical protein